MNEDLREIQANPRHQNQATDFYELTTSFALENNLITSKYRSQKFFCGKKSFRGQT